MSNTDVKKWFAKDFIHCVRICVCVCVYLCCDMSACARIKYGIHEDSRLLKIKFPASDFCMCVCLCVSEMWDFAAKIRTSLKMMPQASAINVCQLTNGAASFLMKLSLCSLRPASGMMDLISDEVVASLTDRLWRVSLYAAKMWSQMWIRSRLGLNSSGVRPELNMSWARLVLSCRWTHALFDAVSESGNVEKYRQNASPASITCNFLYIMNSSPGSRLKNLISTTPKHIKLKMLDGNGKYWIYVNVCSLQVDKCLIKPQGDGSGVGFNLTRGNMAEGARHQWTENEIRTFLSFINNKNRTIILNGKRQWNSRRQLFPVSLGRNFVYELLRCDVMQRDLTMFLFKPFYSRAQGSFSIKMF